MNYGELMTTLHIFLKNLEKSIQGCNVPASGRVIKAAKGPPSGPGKGLMDNVLASLSAGDY